jgi:hypothetical protein
MASNLHNHRTFEEAVETLFKFMGYHTKTNTVLHTRPVRIHAEMHHPSGTQRMVIECKHHVEESVDVKEVEKFCSRIAFARENSEADCGLLISRTNFSPEAESWCARNCSFVELKTYKQLISKSVRFRKLFKKFHKSI